MKCIAEYWIASAMRVVCFEVRKESGDTSGETRLSSAYGEGEKDVYRYKEEEKRSVFQQCVKFLSMHLEHFLEEYDMA